MYLFLYLIFTFINCLYVKCDCGCKLNRNSQCATENTEHNGKYSEKLNRNWIDNKESNKHVLNNALDTSNMVYIDKATFEMGTDKPVFEKDFEGPIRNKTVDAFYLDKYEVSNNKFSEFVTKTGYITEAEHFGDSFIFELLIPEGDREKYKDFRAVEAPWWIKMKGASWKHPEGPKSSLKGSLLVGSFLLTN